MDSESTIVPLSLLRWIKLQHLIFLIVIVRWYAWKQRTTKELHEKGGAAYDLR